MIPKSIAVCVLAVAIYAMLAAGQRPPYAGSRPVGYKDRFRPRPTSVTAATIGGINSINDIDNRFGELDTNLNMTSNSTQRPPIGVEVVYADASDDRQQQSVGQQSSVVDIVAANPAGGGMTTRDDQGEITGRIGSDGQEETVQRQQGQVSGFLSSSSSSATELNQSNIENSSNDLFTGGPSIVPINAATVTQRPVTIRPTIIPFRQTTIGHVPYDAHGDVFLVNLLNRRPIDQQPFWFVNYQAIEAHRNG